LVSINFITKGFLTTTENTIKMIHDCDPGTDDALCIAMALSHPKVKLLAITAESGNLRSDRTSENALKILEYMGITDVPVYKGMAHPLVRPLPSDPYSHGQDGLGNHFFKPPTLKANEKHAALAIIDIVVANPHDITIVCTAPLTNLALAMMLKPEIIPLIKKVYHIGGAYGFTEYAFRNATGDNPLSEWNVYVDPEAASIVYESGVNITTIGLDIAFNPDYVNLSTETIEKLRRIGNKASKFALEIIDYIQKVNTVVDSGMYINGPIDTVAMCTAILPEIITSKEINIAIDTSNQLTRGMTIWDRREHFRWDHLTKIRTAISIDSLAYQRVFVEALAGRR
jgi:inosine-uridine nucleoside N-ribohydrolase